LIDFIGGRQHNNAVNRTVDAVFFRASPQLGQGHHKIMKKPVEIIVVINSLDFDYHPVVDGFRENIQGNIDISYFRTQRRRE
jgi:hypothetical protein